MMVLSSVLIAISFLTLAVAEGGYAAQGYDDDHDILSSVEHPEDGFIVHNGNSTRFNRNLANEMYDENSKKIINNVPWYDNNGDLIEAGRGGQITYIDGAWYWIGSEPASTWVSAAWCLGSRGTKPQQSHFIFVLRTVAWR